LDEGLYPYTKRYLGSFENHFSTIGLIGMNEVGLNAKWLKKDLTHSETQDFAKKVLNHMRERLADYQEKYGDLYNLEATPAESTTYRLAKHDKKHYPEIITASKNEEVPYYTNSSHLPVSFTSDIFDALDIQDQLQTLYTSGTVFHAFLGEKMPNWKAAANLVKKIAENYKLPYYTLSPTYSICRDHGYLPGEQHSCPICGGVTENYSRITGYYRPVQNWNDGKSQEFKERKLYDIDNSVLKAKGASSQIVEPCQVEVKDLNGIASTLDNKILLFTSKTCPNCKMAKIILDSSDLKYEIVDAEENLDLTNQFKIQQAPTLVVVSSGNVQSFANVSNIKKYVKG
jgi:ribonucleoside-triphosphate reductase